MPFPFLLAAALLVPTASAAIAIDPGQNAPPPRHDARGLLPVNADFYLLSASTGGDFYFWAPGEFGNQIALPLLGGDEVVLAYGSFDGRRSIPIPVESGVHELTVFAGAQRKDRAVLVRPDGAIVADGDKGARLQTPRHMLLAKVADPVTGIWRLDVEGAGQYSISAHVRPGPGSDALTVGDFEYVEMGGRPGHEGWFARQRTPRPGETVECQVEVFGFVTDVHVEAVGADGRRLAVLPMTAQPGEPRYFGRCVVPDRPYRIVVTGRDERGRPFRRIERGLRTHGR